MREPLTMQRPTRIIVFGIFCLIIAFFSALDNGGKLIYAIGGPQFIQWMQDVSARQSMPKSIKESYEQAYTMMDAALRKPVYRIGLGIKSSLSLIMAGVLFVAGIGLLFSRLWSIRLTRIWGFYALVAAAVTVTLHFRYLMPENMDAPPGLNVTDIAYMLLLLWFFPVLLITMLGRPVVLEYLHWRQRQPRNVAPQPHATHPQMVPPAQPPHNPPMAPNEPPLEASSTPDRTQKRSPSPPTTPPSPAPAQETWRDDPWNDPNSK